MKNLKFKTFSIKKLLTTILYTVVISVFIGTTILFLLSVPEAIQAEMIVCMQNSENVRKIGKNYEEQVQQIEEYINECKELYGEDYPVGGILFCQFLSELSTGRIIKGYLLSLIIGVVLGIIIYIVAIQKIPKEEVVIELMFAFVILLILAIILNVGYEAIINKIIINSNNSSTEEYSLYSSNIDLTTNFFNILLSYIIAAGGIYIVNIIRQKIITNKLNKQLNKKKIDSKQKDV